MAERPSVAGNVWGEGAMSLNSLALEDQERYSLRKAIISMQITSPLAVELRDYNWKKKKKMGPQTIENRNTKEIMNRKTKSNI